MEKGGSRSKRKQPLLRKRARVGRESPRDNIAILWKTFTVDGKFINKS